MTYYRVDYNSTRSALRLSFLEERRPLSRSLDKGFFSSPYTSVIEGLGGFILLDLLLYPVSALFQWRVSTFKMRDAAEFAIILT